MSPRQRKKVSRTTPTMKELQMMVEHHLCKQAQGEEEEEAAAAGQEHGPGHCHHGDTEHSHSPGGTCPLATHEGGPGPGEYRSSLAPSLCPGSFPAPGAGGVGGAGM
ncbi:PPR1A phosphatase, partial [Cochlearius cochlearius]|nr:PPR1A phosphatase [Cochlearius cochlearius]